MKLPVLFMTVLSGLISGTLWCEPHTAIAPVSGILPSLLTPVLIAKFSLFSALLLVWVLICGKIGKLLFRLPTIASQIIAGMLLGPSLLNIAGWSLFADTITVSQGMSLASSDLFIAVLVIISSAWTVSYLLWIAGHETDVSDIYRIGLVAVVAGFLGAVFPILMTVGGMHVLQIPGWGMHAIWGLGLAFAATSVSIPVAMLIAADKMHLKSSKATLGAAIVDDILAVIFLSLYFIAVQAGVFGCITDDMVCATHGASLLGSVMFMLVAFVCIALFGLFVKPVLMRWLFAHKYVHMIAPLAQVNMQLHFAFAELFGGLAGITGAYFSGLFHKRQDISHHAQQVFTPYVHAVLLPLFLGSIGLQINVGILGYSDWLLVLLLLVISIVSKFIGCWCATTVSNGVTRNTKTLWTWLDTYLFGASMVARGEVGLVIASVLYSAKILTISQYVVAIVVIVATTVAAPILLALGFYIMRSVREVSSLYTASCGPFLVVGTQQMFDIILTQLEAAGVCKMIIDMGEGKRVVHIEGQQIEVVVNPETGIVFTGNRDTVERMMRRVKEALAQDVAQLAVRPSDH